MKSSSFFCIIQARKRLLFMSLAAVCSRRCVAFSATFHHLPQGRLQTFAAKRAQYKRLFASSNDDTDRPIPPTLEASRNYHNGPTYEEQFGAAEYDGFQDTYDQETVLPPEVCDYPPNQTTTDFSDNLDQQPSLALFSDQEDAPTVSRRPRAAVPSRRSSLFPELDIGGEISPEITLSNDLPLYDSVPPPSGIQRRQDSRDDLYIKGSNGNAITTDIEAMNEQLESITLAIYQLNKGESFNINSNKQLSIVLFGRAGESTDKDSLYAIASAGNKLADLVLQYRKCKVDIRRMERKTIHQEKGVYVKSAIQHADVDSVRDPLLLVDASAYIFRAYYSMPPFHRADGTPVGAVMGFCNMLNKLILNRLLAGEQPRMILVFDPIGKNFRHDIYPDYKANRKECPMDLKPQFALIREAAKAYGIHELEADGYEADDVIATLVVMAMKEGVDCHILSGDKDLMQLVTPPERTSSYVHIIDPMSMTRVDHKAVVEKWGVGPELIGDLLAIIGDVSDNIPGIKGLGPKSATSLLNQFKSLDSILADPSAIEKKAQRTKIEENIDVARLSRRLVELVRDIPRESMSFPDNCLTVADMRMEGLVSERLLKFYGQMGFREMKNRLEGRLSSKPVAPRKKKAPWREKATVPEPKDFLDVPF